MNNNDFAMGRARKEEELFGESHSRDLRVMLLSHPTTLSGVPANFFPRTINIWRTGGFPDRRRKVSSWKLEMRYACWSVQACLPSRCLSRVISFNSARPNASTAHQLENRRMSVSTPQPDVTINGRVYRQVKEGTASILAPYRKADPVKSGAPHPKNNDEGNQAVFYNPIQQFNRDLSVLSILVYGEGAIAEKLEQQRFKQQNKHDHRKKRQRLHATSDKQGKNEDPRIPESRKRKADEQASRGEVEGQDVAKRQRLREENGADEGLAVIELTTPKQSTGMIVSKIAKDTSYSLGHTSNTQNDEKSTASGKTSSDTNEEHRPTHTSVSPRHSAPTKIAFTILDALSATGLRALRYAREIPFATKIIANDMSKEAVESIELNVEHNDLKDVVFPHVGDARSFMYSKVGNELLRSDPNYVHRFDVIDLDPYGTAVPFFDAAFQALADGGLLCVTCTDAGVFASVGYSEKTYDLYGGMPLKGAHSHEGGLRLILHSLASSAAKYGIAIEPLLSLSIDFYARVFIRVHRKQTDVKLLAGTTMILYSCDHGCGSWEVQPLQRNRAEEDKRGEKYFKYSIARAPLASRSCEHCGSIMHLGGPMWAGPLHNPSFVQKMLDKLPTLRQKDFGTLDRLEGMLTLAMEEDLTLEKSNTGQNNTEQVQHDSQDPHKTNASSAPDESKLIPRLPPEAIDQSPFFFIPNYLSKVLHCETPSEAQIKGALRHLGYKVTRSHCKAGSVKTDAPWTVIWEIMREWIRTQKSIKEGKLSKGTPGWAILGGMRGSDRGQVKEIKVGLNELLSRADSPAELKSALQSAMYQLEHPFVKVEDSTTGQPAANGENGHPQEEHGERDRALTEEAANSSIGSHPPATAIRRMEVVFDAKLGKEKPRGKLVRYQINPRANWGPMNRAGGQ